MKLGLVVAACIVVSSPLRAQALREGRITIVRATSGSSVDAVFSTQPAWGPIIATDGPCTLRGPDAKATLSAGTIAITGTVEPITLEDQAEKYSPAKRVPNPAFIDGATINVEASGTADVPAFSASVDAPTTPADYAPPSRLSRAGYTATWMPVAGAHMMIMIGAFQSAN